MDQAAERIESLKAGLAGAAAAASAVGLAIAGQVWLNLGLNLAPAALGLQTAVALLSGFLFGVTYRYVIRADRNSHLQSGAVLAFGLVRGLALAQSLRLDWQAALQIGLQVAESLLLFGLAALLIDWLMRRGWIKQFS
ncbi:hypothetical protein [Rivularia sp. UHCC 0363]|uniref:hypothetical protein n=1 Tax=Rivularia sp. UHCC 0363 TaxID=3110244 RepID=UPI002B214B28|nr:hypothetical protein [Rivularia sp. UHCC 0363]MEA5597458.1 hypothetical protein [Rivularia sp. UHCC 0363]